MSEIKGTITLMDRLGRKVNIEIEGQDQKDFSSSMTRMTRMLGAYGFTPDDVPAGGFVLPYANEANFDWDTLGAKPTQVKRNGEMLDGVYYRGEFYTRRVTEAKKVGQATIPKAVIYSRGFKPTDDMSKVSGDEKDNFRYVTLVIFKVFGGLGEDFKYPGFDKGEESYTKPAYNNNGSAKLAANQANYIQLRNAAAFLYEQRGKPAKTEAELKERLLATANKNYKTEKTDILSFSPTQNYEMIQQIASVLLEKGRIDSLDYKFPETNFPDTPKRNPTPQAKSPNQEAPAPAPANQRKAKAPAAAVIDDDELEEIVNAANSSKKSKKSEPEPAPKKSKAPKAPVIEEEDDEDEEEVIPAPKKARKAAPVVEVMEEDDEDDDLDLDDDLDEDGEEDGDDDGSEDNDEEDDAEEDESESDEEDGDEESDEEASDGSESDEDEDW